MAVPKKGSARHGQESTSDVLPVREVAANIWVPFFSDLNNRHRGDRVDIDVVDSNGGPPRTEWRQRRLQSISSMLGRPGEPDALSIAISEDDQRLVIRSIADVRTVRLFNGGGEDEKLEVEAADGEKVILVFHR